MWGDVVVVRLGRKSGGGGVRIWGFKSILTYIPMASDKGRRARVHGARQKED